jgi:inorganic pyrophosphatase
VTTSDRDTVIAFIEIPQGSRNKYEYDEERKAFFLDRVLFHSVHYPADYGWIPDTLASDGDHVDVLVLMQEPTFPGCMIEARPIGGLDMHDEKGHDFKVLAVPVGDPRFAHVTSLEGLGSHWLKEIEAFFSTYKLLESKDTEIVGWFDAAYAWEQIEDGRRRYTEHHPVTG